jgi:hypothetical protein
VSILSRLRVALLGIAASAIAAALIVDDYHNIIDVFQLADPSGFFGVYDHLGGLLANGAVIFVALAVLFRSSGSELGLGYAAIAFVPSVLEAIAVLPCFLSARPGALCGVGLILVSWLAIPIVLIAATAFVWASHSRAIKVVGLGAAVTFLGVVGAGEALLAPAEASQCQRLPEVTKRSNCLNVFAQRAHDEEICRSIEFRSTRFACLREIAVAKGEAQLCEEIADRSPIAAFESPAAFSRDVCFQNVAFRLHDPSQCARVENPELRISCQHALQ